MANYLPKVAGRLELRVMSGPHVGAHSTYVEEVSAAGLVVAVPIVGEVPIELQAGDQVRCEYPQGTAAYISFVTAVRSVRGGLVPTVTLELPEPKQVQRVQRRAFVRLETVLPVIYQVLSRPDGVRVERGEAITSRTFDLSGSGALVWAPEPVPLASRLRLLLKLPRESLSILSEVVRLARSEEAGDESELWLGLRFEEMGDREREVVIRYIFAEQRERRRKGLL